MTASSWAALAKPVLAAPGTPPQSEWTRGAPPPDVANQEITDIVNQQMKDQQAIDAARVESSAGDVILGAAGSAGSAVQTAVESVTSIPSWLWILGGGLLAFAFISGGRR